MQKRDKYIGKNPGVLYKTVEGYDFYVDVLWAMAVEDRQKLNTILFLKQPSLADKLKELTLRDPMRSVYIVASKIVKRDKQSRAYNSVYRRFIQWYYYVLSPFMVEWQLDHPKTNKIMSKITTRTCHVLLGMLKVKNISDSELLELKETLRSYKYDANVNIQPYLNIK